MKKYASLLDYSYPGLSPDIWQADGTLLPYHKDYILKLITSFYETYKFKDPLKWVKDITIVGSLTTNKYLRTSDFDCHVVVSLKDFQETNMPDVSEEEAALYLDNARKEWDRARILLPFGEHPLELYFESELSPSNVKAVGRYSMVSNAWLKEPVFFAQDDDYEVSKKKIVDEAIKMANELDASFGNIRRDIQRIDELKQVAQAWPIDTRDFYMEKIQKKLDSIEEEIEKAVELQQALIDERHEKQDPYSENEVKFKYLARFFYFYVISELKDLMKKTDGEVTETELPVIKRIVTEAAKNPEATETDICIDFDHTIANGATYPDIGEPIEGAKESLTKLKEMGYNVIIYTCRSDSKEGTEVVREWLDKYEMSYDSIFQGEKPFAKYYIDDRAIHFDNWDSVLKQVGKSDKKASLQISAYRAKKLWFDPNGKEYAVGNSGAHADWILDNADFLKKKYGFNSSRWKRDEEGYIADFEGLDSALIATGWSRIGDIDAGWGIEVANLRHIPEYLIDRLAGHSGEVTFEDINRNWVIVNIYDFETQGQKAVNKALQQKRLQMASLLVLAAAQWPEAFYLSPTGKLYPVSRTHDEWLVMNTDLLKKEYNLDFRKAYGKAFDASVGDIMDALLSYGWTRGSVAANHRDYIAQVNAIQSVPNTAIDFFLGGPDNMKLTIEDASESNFVTVTKDDLLQGQKGINKAFRMQRNGSLVRYAAYNHAYWIAPDNKVFEVRGATGNETSPKSTHNAWIQKNLPLLESQYNLKPIKTQWGTSLGSSDLLDQGWTRVGDGYDSDWGITVSDIGHIPTSVDNLLAQFAHQGATITIEDRNWKNGATFEWPVKSVQQAVNQFLMRQKQTPAFQPQMAASTFPLSKRDIKALNLRLDPSLKQGPAYAVYIGEQDMGADQPAVKMYNILGDHPRFGSTVFEQTIKELGIPIRQEKQAQTKKVKQGEYGAVMALVPHNVAQEVVEWGVRNIPDKDVYDNPDKPRLGRELESHITIKYGLLTEDAKTVRRFFNESKPFKAKLGKVRHFQPPEMDFDVVTVEIISEDLDRINAELTKEFECAEGLPSDTYHPHITVSYVKRDTGKDYIGSTDFDGIEVELDTIIFSPAKGNRTYFSVSQDKEGAFHVEKIRKNAFGNMQSTWITPEGEVIPVEMGDHSGWVADNMDWIPSKYSDIDFSDYYKAVEADDPDEIETSLYHLVLDLIGEGWVRVFQSDDNLIFQIKSLGQLPTNIEDFFLQQIHSSNNIVVEDLTGANVTITEPELGFVKAVQKGLQRKRMGKQAAKVEDVDGIRVYINPSQDELTNLSKSFHQEFMNLPSIRALIDNRTGDIYAWDGWFQEHTSMKKMLGLEDAVHWDGGSDDVSHLYALREDLVREHTHQKQADFLPSFVQAPDNDWQFAGGGDDKEIPVDPSPVSDEQTLMDPCQTDKPRKNQMWKELWHMIKTPFSKKETEAAADTEQENIEKNELGEDETLLEYSKHFKDLNRFNTNKPKTTWDAGPSKAPNQQEPYSPLPVTLDVVTNPDNENWRYPWRFTRRPVGDQSNQGEVTQALEHMLQNLASMQKKAALQEEYWITPDGELQYVDDGHKNWIQDNFDIISQQGTNTFDDESDDPDYQVNKIYREMLKTGWTRVGQSMLASDPTFYIEVGSIGKIPGYIDNFVSQWFDAGKSVLNVGDLGGHLIEITDPFPSLQKAVNKALQRKRMGKQAGMIMDIGGARVYKNPTGNQVYHLFNKAKEKMLRFYVSSTDELYVWDAYDLEHASVMEAIGDEYTSNNYAGAGTYLNAYDAANHADNFRKNKKKASWEGGWIDPKGKLYPTGEHESFVRGNPKLFHITKADAYNMSDMDIFATAYGDGWTRVRNFGNNLLVESLNMRYARNADAFIHEQLNSGIVVVELVLEEENKQYTAYVEDFKEEGWDAFTREAPQVLAKQAGQVIRTTNEQGEGVKIFQNPNEAQIRHFMSQVSEGGLRYLVDEHGGLYVWDAMAMIHDEVKADLGIEYTEVEGYIQDERDIRTVFDKIVKTSIGKKAWGQSNSVPDYLMDEWKRDQIHDDVDSEPYVNHDQRDYPYGMHDSPENTDSNIGWAKDNEPYVVRLDQIEKPFNRKWAPGLPEYQVFFFDTMPMSDGSEI